MKLLFLVLALTSPFCYGAFNLRPGLWSIEMTMKDASGKVSSPLAQMEEAMANMSEAEKKKVLAMMKEMGQEVPTAQGTKVCFSEEMMKRPENISYRPNDGCTTKIIKNTDKKIVSSFSCKDGTKGSMDIDIQGAESYKGIVNMTSPQTGKSQIKYSGKYVSKDCGKLKPLKS